MSQKGGRRKKSQKGSRRKRLYKPLWLQTGAQSTGGQRKKRNGVRRNGKAVGVVFPRAMTSKQRKSLPAKDIFG